MFINIASIARDALTIRLAIRSFWHKGDSSMRMAFACLGLALTAQAASAQEVTAYSYDALGRLTGTTITNGPANGTTAGSAYDPVGNRVTTVTAGGVGPQPKVALIVIPLGNGFYTIPIFTSLK